MYRPGFTVLGSGFLTCSFYHLDLWHIVECQLNLARQDYSMQVGVRDVDRKGVFLYYEFSEKPELSSQTKWNVSNCVLVPSYKDMKHCSQLQQVTLGDLDGWYVEISFMVRIVTYIAILGILAIMIFLFLKYVGRCENNGQGHEEEAQVREVTETSPLLSETKLSRLPYGTQEEDLESNRSSSWEDRKICVICYDTPRNSFFVPCGHWATCFDCGQRILDGESKVCPICRRLIHKLRKLIIP